MSEPVKLERLGAHLIRLDRVRKMLCGLRRDEVALTVHAPACSRCVQLAGKLLTPKQRIPSALELAFDAQVERERVAGGMVREHRFAESVGRLWAFDRCWPALKTAVELDGGTFMAKGKSHGWGTGREDDAVRDAAATLLGWKVFRVTPNILAGGYCWRWIRAAMGYAEHTASMFPKGRELRPPKMRANPQARRNEARA